jgi:hypothetical protein
VIGVDRHLGVGQLHLRGTALPHIDHGGDERGRAPRLPLNGRKPPAALRPPSDVSGPLDGSVDSLVGNRRRAGRDNRLACTTARQRRCRRTASCKRTRLALKCVAIKMTTAAIAFQRHTIAGTDPEASTVPQSICV